MIYFKKKCGFLTIWWQVIFGCLCPTFVCQYCRRAYIWTTVNRRKNWMTDRWQTHIYTWFTGESDILVMTAVMIAIGAVQQAVFITQAVNAGQPDDARLTDELIFRYSSSVIPGQYPSVCDSHRIWFTKEHTKWHQTVRSRHKEKLFTFIYRPEGIHRSIQLQNQTSGLHVPAL